MSKILDLSWWWTERDIIARLFFGLLTIFAASGAAWNPDSAAAITVGMDAAGGTILLLLLSCFGCLTVADVIASDCLSCRYRIHFMDGRRWRVYTIMGACWIIPVYVVLSAHGADVPVGGYLGMSAYGFVLGIRDASALGRGRACELRAD